ncbi:Spy/CpxP family protein refolding chaperone [Larkinella arboricola]|uniref:Heavy-metal resistance protein n=1 Tax=Larkinella arboricola TaxID=643671 RepID=A0A327XB44_LARAB|nr:periplasmic heavy metal sensor [Larkinella arboricola]RAK03093.1 heavy-metal resistance protein [Larkinella arboricola]
MNDQKRYRLLVGIIVALILLNAGLMAWMWFGPGRHREGRGDGRTYLSKTLGLSDEQRTVYRAMRQKHFQTIRPLLDSLRQERRRFFALVDDSTQTDGQLMLRARQLEEKNARLDVLTLRHFQQVSALCTPEQRNKLKQVLAERPGFGSFGRTGWPGRHRPDSSQRDRSEK